MSSRQEKVRLGVIFGGRSGEHEISIRSARFVVGALDRRCFDLTLIGIDRKGRWHLHTEETFRQFRPDMAAQGATEIVPAPRANGCALIDLRKPERVHPHLDVVFPVLHGPFGEDGTIQGTFEMLDVPYVGAGVLGAAIGMDKDVQKRLLQEAGLPIVPFRVVTQYQWEQDPETVRAQAGHLGSPLFVKPASLGSSLGINRINRANALDHGINEALAFDTKVLLERGLDAREIECAVLGNEAPLASLPGEIVPAAEFYSYEAKYAATSTAELLIPAPLNDDQAGLVKALAVRVFQVLQCAGMARVDFFLERSSEHLFVNEINTIPGFTSISMYPKLWEASGLPHSALITRLIDLALERHSRRSGGGHGPQVNRS